MSDVVIFHKNCFDGICSAWVASKKMPKATFFPMAYGERISDILRMVLKDDTVYFIDFSLPKEGLKMVANMVNKIVVLDHHKTAEAELKGFAHPNAEIIFDMDNCGAQLAWDYFFSELKRPELVDYVGDRDLWRFALPESEYINAYIQSFPMTIEAYDMLNYEFETIGLSQAITGGKAITRYKNECVERICKLAVIDQGAFSVAVVNSSILFSEVGHRLCELHPEAIYADVWFVRSDNKIQHSLRSIGDFDVSSVAKQHGGGGHKNAAGYEEDVLGK